MSAYGAESFLRSTIRQSVDNIQTCPFTLKVSKVPALTTGLLTISGNTNNEELLEYNGVDGALFTVTVTKRGINPSSQALTTSGVDYDNPTYQKAHSQNDTLRGDINHLHIIQDYGSLQTQINNKVNSAGGTRTGLGAARQTLEVDATGVEVKKNIVDGTTISSAETLRKRKADGTYEEIPFSYVTGLISSLNKIYYGDGSDGDVTISTNTTLTRDMYYNNLTVNTGIILNPDGYSIHVLQTLNLVGTAKIRRNGNNGNNGVTPVGSGSSAGGAATASLNTGTCGVSGGGSAGGAGNIGAGTVGVVGTSVNPSYATTSTVGKNGGKGGMGVNLSNDGGVGGVGGTATQGILKNILYGVARLLINLVSPSRGLSLSAAVTQYFGMPTSGGGGGGGGDGSGAASGGGGGSAGSNGGIIFIYAFIITGTGTIEAIGGTGGNGGNGFGITGGGGGGGGGGNGGIVVLVYNTGSPYSTTLTGGTGGTGGTLSGSGQNGVNGQTGTTGQLITIVV